MRLPLLLLAISLSTSTPAQRLQSDLTDISPNIRLPYPCTFTGFDNAKAGVFEIRQKPELVQLSHGSFRHVESEGGGEQVELTKNVELDGKRVLVFYWTWWGGSSSQSQVIQVLECREDYWFVSQQISTDAHGNPGPVEFADLGDKNKRIAVYSTVYGRGAHCCPEFRERVTYNWNGKRFVEASRKLIKNK